jgi:hypothetical protein
MDTERPQPWYKVPVMWLVIAAPLSAVIGGFATLYLAVTTRDGMVVDDYYRHGKQINQVLALDQAAARRGLSAVLELDSATRGARVVLAGDAPAPGSLELSLVHATRSGFDRQLTLPRAADGSYRGVLPALPPGGWNVQLSADDWRLVGRLSLPGSARVEFTPWLTAP